mmetsp:Transcript_49797/g.132083  ORF Transcript_49797/g.132083 Transcript_49797/m.132083 type:complete len:274 (-) Transcript_49797:164-985(-)
MGRGEVRQVERFDAGHVLERVFVRVLLVRRVRLRPVACGRPGEQGPLLHNVRSRRMVSRGAMWVFRRLVHLLETGRALRHLPSRHRQEACDRTSVVASFHGAVVLLAFVLHAHRHRSLVRGNELLCALDHVRLFCPHGHQVPQVRDALCNVHHSRPTVADGRGDVCHRQGRTLRVFRHAVQREQDQLNPGAWDVFQLLRFVSDPLHRQLLWEEEEEPGTPAEAAIERNTAHPEGKFFHCTRCQSRAGRDCRRRLCRQEEGTINFEFLLCLGFL